MSFLQPDLLRYYVFDSLQGRGVQHAIFTRQGGVSPAPWRSLNVGGTVGDDPQRVGENRRRMFQAIGIDPSGMYDVWQVHGTHVVCTDAPRLPHAEHIQADAILTDCPGVSLFMRFADCVPIILYDPARCVVGLVHAGWKGTVLRAAAEAVHVMQTRYGSRAGDILAGIGPSIAAHHYPVGEEVVQQVEKAFGEDSPELLSSNFQDSRKSGVQFDLWAANRLVLEQAGVSQIEISGVCTACSLDDWYSHRGEAGRTGRFGAVIALS